MAELSLPEAGDLRPLTQGDDAELHALIEANREHLARWLGWAEAQTPADSASFIELARAQLIQRSGLQMAILRSSSMIGVIGAHPIDWVNRSMRIGYWLSAEEQGKGTMTAAVRRLTDHAFSRWNLNRVEIRAALGNHRSRAIAERLRFRHEGTLRESERVRGTYLDCAVYAALAREWASGAGQGDLTKTNQRPS